ncbi:MAG: sulfide/dihydroorotate dehydrogenase-like FAD/NAD-binding protein [Candidatus Thermoplasmatota archaeon]|nr:sulfide/dihydroorotate dehydrogenase-like FAD/NAD-binding protein [Candidatus Thermoplasmatota archaeon]
MFQIIKHQQFSPVTFLWEILAPDLAKASKPGQFVMVRIREGGERIPLTIADYDVEKGTITLVIQAVGRSSNEMNDLKEGDYLLDLMGPLGIPSHIDKKEGRVVLVGGGLGVAPIYPQLRKYKEMGNHTISIMGFRNEDLIFWADRFIKYSNEFHVATDDGSAGTKGFVTNVLDDVLKRNDDIAEVVAIGPLVMMKACAEVSRKYGIKTIVSLNTIMVDGIGMCGSCRVTVDGKVKFACVDGPDFDAHLVDWDELMIRQKRFDKEESHAQECWEQDCRAKKKFEEGQ